MDKLSDVGSSYGAPMGRSSECSDRNFSGTFEVARLKWVDGAYDEGGAYWGAGDYIFRAEGESDAGAETMFVRAKDLVSAKAEILLTYPKAEFSASSDTDSFTSSYREAALWSSSNNRYEDDPENQSEMLDDAGYEVSPETEAKFLEDCEEFLVQNAELITLAVDMNGYTIDRAGHDFWLTRNGHGTGFWDQNLGDVGDKLSKAARGFGGVDLYVGDDDLVHMYGEKPIITPTQNPVP